MLHSPNHGQKLLSNSKQSKFTPNTVSNEKYNSSIHYPSIMDHHSSYPTSTLKHTSKSLSPIPSPPPLQQQRLSFDIILEREINKIINEKLKDKQQEQRMNFISLCKVLNKTYENSDKLDGIINKFNISDITNQNKIDCSTKYMSEILDFMKQIDNNQQELFKKLNSIDQLKSNGLKLNKDLINMQNKLTIMNDQLLAQQQQQQLQHQQIIKKFGNLNKKSKINDINKKLDLMQKQIICMDKKLTNIDIEHQIDAIRSTINDQTIKSQQFIINNKHENVLINKLNKFECHKNIINQKLNKIHTDTNNRFELLDQKLTKYNHIIKHNQINLLNASVAIQGIKLELKKIPNMTFNNIVNDNLNDTKSATIKDDTSVNTKTNCSIASLKENVYIATNNIDRNNDLEQAVINKKISKINNYKTNNNNKFKKNNKKIKKNKNNNKKSSKHNLNKLQEQNTLILNYLNNINYSLEQNKHLILSKLDRTNQCINNNINVSTHLLQNNESQLSKINVLIGNIKVNMESINENIDDSTIITNVCNLMDDRRM